MTQAVASQYCSCETVAHGDLGLIKHDEPVARVVCDPRHILKKGGGIKPGVFPPSHISTKGLSLIRPNHLYPAALRKHADAIASNDPKDKAVGVIECEASNIRAFVGADGTRIVCLFDDPIENDPKLPDNPAHASLIAAKEIPEDDINEVRDYLLGLFSELRRFDD